MITMSSIGFRLLIFLIMTHLFPPPPRPTKFGDIGDHSGPVPADFMFGGSWPSTEPCGFMSGSAQRHGLTGPLVKSLIRRSRGVGDQTKDFWVQGEWVIHSQRWTLGGGSLIKYRLCMRSLIVPKLFSIRVVRDKRHKHTNIVLQISRLSEGSTGQIFATSSVIYQIKMWGL